MRAFSRCGIICALSIAATGSLSAPTEYAPKVKETVHAPHGWIKHGAPSPDHNIVLRIGLPQPNFHALETHLFEVSNPVHDRYGAYLSKEEVESLIAPHPESLDLVDKWLNSHGIDENSLSRSPAKDWVILTIPVSLAEKMLDTVRLRNCYT